MVPSITGHLSISAPRCGQAPGPATSSPEELRQKTTSRPAMVRATDSFDPTSSLAPATNQPPEFWACDTARAAAIRPGLASRQVEGIRSSRGCGTREMGTRVRMAAVERRDRRVRRDSGRAGVAPAFSSSRVLSDTAAPRSVQFRSC